MRPRLEPARSGMMVLTRWMTIIALGWITWTTTQNASGQDANGEPLPPASVVPASNNENSQPIGEADVGPDKLTNAVVIQLKGPIDYSMRRFFHRSLVSAETMGVQVVILDIDSPGGMLDATVEMVDEINAAEQIQFVAFIRHSAYSGAAMLALACERIVMHPEAQFGDVGVIVGGLFSPFQYVDEKQRSPVVTQIRTLAEAHRRPPALAEAMVDKDVVVFQAKRTDDGTVRYFTDKEWDSLAAPEQWEKGPPVFESRDGKFLTVNGSRALELGLANGIQRSLDTLLDDLQVTRPVRVIAWTWVDGLLDWLNSYWITGLLLFIGFIALLVEFSSPGLGVGGLLALLCFSLFFWSRFLGGTAGWLEVILFLSGLAFVAAEFFVIPGFGIAGISGIGLLVLSLVMASRRVLWPSSGAEWGELGFNFFMVLTVFAAVLVTGFLLADRMTNFPLFRRLVLTPPVFHGIEPGTSNGKKAEPVATWQRLGIGDLGYSLSPLRPSGKGQFADEIVDVSTEGEFIAAETPIRVIRKRGSQILVREA